MNETAAPKPKTGLEDWLKAARHGDRTALGDGLEACRRYLLWVARRELDPGLMPKGGPSDLVQETFLEAQRDFAQFEGSSEAELLAWLRRLLLNNIANFVRRYRETAKRGVDREVSLAPDAERPSPDASPAEGMAQREQLQILLRLLERLPDDYRRVVTLWYKEHSFEEIGEMMGRSTNAARMLWMRAIERLQQAAAE